MDMPWKDAILKVLRTKGEAMHYAEIARQIQLKKLRTSVGATPANSVHITISSSIKNEGDESPFVKSGAGEFMLRQPGLSAKKKGRTSVSAKEDESVETGGIIQAFGMFWRREWVEWNAKPKLMGVQQEGATPVNFAEQTGVYLLHDGREVVYVGRMTENRLAARLSEHTRDRLNGRWDRFSWFGLLDVTEDGNLAEIELNSISADDVITTMEALLIEGLEPRQNRKRGDAFRAVEYLQHLDPELAKKAKRKLAEEILSKL